jgi:hypothetical protein
VLPPTLASFLFGYLVDVAGRRRKYTALGQSCPSSFSEFARMKTETRASDYGLAEITRILRIPMK